MLYTKALHTLYSLTAVQFTWPYQHTSLHHESLNVADTDSSGPWHPIPVNRKVTKESKR